MKPKPKHGGRRPGQGRPPIKPGEKSARYALVMPESLKAAAVEMGPDRVRELIEKESHK